MHLYTGNDNSCTSVLQYKNTSFKYRMLVMRPQISLYPYTQSDEPQLILSMNTADPYQTFYQTPLMRRLACLFSIRHKVNFLALHIISLSLMNRLQVC